MSIKLSDAKKVTIGFATKISWQSIARMYNEQAEKHGLSISAAYLLLHIESEGIQVTHLGPAIGMEPSSITRLINNMESKGLLIRQRGSKSDRRKVMIFLTDEGKQAKALTQHKVRHFNKKVRAIVSDEELRSFYSVLERVNDIVSGGKVFEDEEAFSYNPFEL